MNYEILYGFITATALLAVFPGPDNIYVITQSIAHGVRFGLATVFGLITGCLIHTSLLAFGVSALIKENEQVYFVLKLFGAAYLLYLALGVFKSTNVIGIPNASLPKKSTLSLFKQGFIMNVLNPKVALFFLAFFPGFLFSSELNTVWQFYILGGLFMLVSFLVFCTMAFLSGSISKYLNRHTKTGLYLKWLQILVFVGLAIYILISE